MQCILEFSKLRWQSRCHQRRTTRLHTSVHYSSRSLNIMFKLTLIKDVPSAYLISRKFSSFGILFDRVLILNLLSVSITYFCTLPVRSSALKASIAFSFGPCLQLKYRNELICSLQQPLKRIWYEFLYFSAKSRIYYSTAKSL